MKSYNQELFDALVRHQIYLLRYSGSVRNKIFQLLNKTEQDIANQIRIKLENHKGLDTAGFRKLKALEEYIKKVRLKSWEQIDSLWASEMLELAKQEPEVMKDIINTIVPVSLDVILPAPGLLKALVNSYPFEGRVLKEWSKGIAKTDIQRMTDQIKIGMVQGETSSQIARRIVGSAQLKGSDGVTEITRRDAQGLTRTAVNALASAARRQFYLDNSELFSKEMFVATLDSRTTPVCRANDGKVYDIGEGPMPPLHWNCRSLRVVTLNGELLGSRPAKPTTEKMMLREYNKQEGLSAKTRDDLPRGHKGLFDSFMSTRVRSLTGQVDAKLTYNKWLGSQSKEFQVEVLGKTRQALFSKGKLSLDKFVNKNGDELTLAQLRKLHENAFIAAGLK